MFLQIHQLSVFEFWGVLVVMFPLDPSQFVEAMSNEGTTASVQHLHIQGCSPSCKPSLKNQEGNQYLSSLSREGRSMINSFKQALQMGSQLENSRF